MLPKYIVGDNPVDCQDRIFIIQTADPYILAEAFHFDECDSAAMECKRSFNVGASLDYAESEYIVLGALSYENCDEDRLAKSIREMADWYELYLSYEDAEQQ